MIAEAQQCAAWALPCADLVRWMGLVETLAPLLLQDVITRVIEDLANKSRGVEVKVPGYGHLINDTKLTLSLAKKRVLEHPHREIFGSEALALRTCLRGVEALHGKWSLRTPLREISRIRELIESINSVWDLAKHATAVTLGLKIIVELKGAEQADHLSALTDSQLALMPKTLRGQLSAMKTKQPQPQPECAPLQDRKDSAPPALKKARLSTKTAKSFG